MESGVIFPREDWHNHASCIVELPDGDLLACWYHGSGERQSDDVLVEGARYARGTGQWSSRFLMADTLEYPDCNPCMFIDARHRLWLVYVTILANEWHTALLKYRVSARLGAGGCPKWDWSEALHVTPGDEFVADLSAEDYSGLIGMDPQEKADVIRRYMIKRQELASSKLFRRLGWMPRAHATLLRDNRIVLPLYSDGFDFSLMLLSDDDGGTWHTSSPIISCGGVQPSVVELDDGTLVAYMRNNGPAPHMIMQSRSADRGETWSSPEYTVLPNPGSGIEAIRLQSGKWIMAHNDTESGRHRLAVSVSNDEGEIWTHQRYIENDNDRDIKGGYSYPSATQTANGDIWITYSSHLPGMGSTIRWTRFDEGWMAGG